MKNRILAAVAVLFCTSQVLAQPLKYSVANAHSHNDYKNPVPFLAAFAAGFGSIEADVFLQDGQLRVAHEQNEIRPELTLEAMYLRPLQYWVRRNNGYPYADTSRHLQMLIELKSENNVESLDTLVALLRRFPELIQGGHIMWVITGRRPDPSTFTSYPDFIGFDGELGRAYTPEALSRVSMLSDDLKQYSYWNGKSNIPADQRDTLQRVIARAHRLGKPVRFWDAPDVINAWYQLMHLGVDYINTDRINELAHFLNTLPDNSFRGAGPGTTEGGASRSVAVSNAPGNSASGGLRLSTDTLYHPTYRSDGAPRKAKNIILLIGDGTGLAQLYAGYTANQGSLNIFSIRNMGLSKTSSYDSYVTDSAPGSTAFASGEKTNNRAVGVDHTGAALTLIPQLLDRKGIQTGLITAGDVTDATPADFFAHRSERDNSVGIFQDLESAPVTVLMGSGNRNFNPTLRAVLEAGHYRIRSSLDSVRADQPGKWLVMDERAGLSMLKGRGDWLPRAFDKTVSILSQNKAGFFLMAEGAQVDYGGHANSLPYVVTEVLDFDQVVGQALRFADQDGQTLVIVTADHETGGLSLLDGDIPKGYVSGQFSTNDHTGIPVPVFAYGPGAEMFRGVYENTELFRKMLKAMGL